MDVVSLAILAVFLIIITLASLEKMEKAVLALIGIITVYLILNLSEGISFDEMIHFIDFKVLVTILGFMIIVEASKESGLFHFISLRTVKISGGEPVQLFIVLCIITSILAMFLTAMATMIIIGTLTITIARMLKIDPAPYLLAEAIIVDVGGMAFPFSQIANIIISQGVGLSLVFFIINVLPFVLISFIFSLWYLSRQLKTRLGFVDPLRKMLILEANEWIFVPDIKVFKRTAIIFAGIIIGLIIIPEIYIVAMGGATLFLLASGVKPEEIFNGIDWSTLFFFSGLYIIVGAMEHKGLLHEAGAALASFTMGNILVATVLILWIVGLLSCVVDNVAIAIAFIPIVKAMAETSGLGVLIDILWLAMILGTNLGGNILPYGAPTTILAMGIGKKYGRGFKPKDFFKIGSIWGISNLGLATLYLLVRLYIGLLIEIIGWQIIMVSTTVMIAISVILVIYRKIGLKALKLGISRTLKKLKRSIINLINKFFTHRSRE